MVAFLGNGGCIAFVAIDLFAIFLVDLHFLDDDVTMLLARLRLVVFQGSKWWFVCVRYDVSHVQK